MTGLDIGWRDPIDLSIVHVDVEIGQKSPPWSHALDPIQGEVEVGMRGMGPKAHRIDDQHLHAGHDLQRLLGQAHDVVGVGHRAEPQAKRAGGAMVLDEWHHGTSRRLERPLDQGRPKDRIVEIVLRLEAVAKAAHQDLLRAPVGPALDRSLAQREGTQVVNAVRLVRMLMGPDHRVDPFDFGIEQLGAQVGRGIHQDGPALALDQDGAAAALVARIGGIGSAPLTLAALPARPRHAARSAAAQDRHPHALRSALANSRKKLSVVTASSSARLTPLSSATLAAVWATNAGSLVLPRFGTGAR